MIKRKHPSCNVTSWHAFDRKVRARGCTLLKRLDEFHDPILVAGCQRSGTTILARVLTQSDGMVDYSWGRDDELDAALILAGVVPHEATGRFCFQTTYLNNCVNEYMEHQNFKLIWVLRNPHSVVYSMLHNWRRSALNRLFRSVGSGLLDESNKWRYERFGVFGIARLKKACLSYNAKVSQLFDLNKSIDADRLMVIDYADLVCAKDKTLESIYRFIGLEYHERYAERVHGRSVNKVEGQSVKERQCIEAMCMPVYTRATEYLTCKQCL